MAVAVPAKPNKTIQEGMARIAEEINGNKTCCVCAGIVGGHGRRRKKQTQRDFDLTLHVTLRTARECPLCVFPPSTAFMPRFRLSRDGFSPPAARRNLQALFYGKAAIYKTVGSSPCKNEQMYT